MDSLEALKKAKIPGPETGIEKKNTVCAICSPAYNCGVCAYVKDGKMVKLEGWMNIQEIRDVYVQKDFPAVVLLTEKTVSRHLFAALAKEEKEI